MNQALLNPCFREALFAWDAALHGDLVTVIHEHGNGCVTQELCWARSASAVREMVPSVALEARLLAGLDAALEMRLLRMKLTPVAGDPAAYLVTWTARGPGH